MNNIIQASNNLSNQCYQITRDVECSSYLSELRPLSSLCFPSTPLLLSLNEDEPAVEVSTPEVDDDISQPSIMLHISVVSKLFSSLKVFLSDRSFLFEMEFTSWLL